MKKRQVIRRMFSFFLLSLLFNTVFSSVALAQENDKKTVSLSMKNVPLVTFFDEVTKQTGLEFVYDADQIKALGEVNINAKDEPVRSVLGQVLNLVSCGYTISGNQVTVTKKNVGDKRKGVYGQITDSSGQPLPGVTIRMEGFNGGYITDMDGKYQIETDKKDVKLTFNYIGYKQLEKTVKNGTAGNFVMHEDADVLGEVVVTGYGTKNKNSFTGSQISVKKEDLMAVGTKNVLKSLANFVPGMSVLDNDVAGSDPNTLADINIRGRATFTGQANMPVFVVDGSQVKVDYVYDMDMNDIESVTVLKDASASALYGAKASAGVIVITTKALKGGKLRLNYSGTLRFSTPDLSDYKLLNASQKLEYERLAGLYSSDDATEQYALQQRYASIYREIQDGVNTDWIAKPLRNAISNQHSLSIDGATSFL